MKLKGFYSSLVAIAIPISLQALLQNFVNMLDTVMIGRLGSVEIAAVGLGNQIFFTPELRDENTAARSDSKKNHIEDKENLISKTDRCNLNTTKPPDHNGVEHVNKVLQESLERNWNCNRKQRRVKAFKFHIALL